MASKTKAVPQEQEVPEKEHSDTQPDAPLLDLSDAAVKKMISRAKKRGYITHQSLNAVMPSDEASSERSRASWRCSTIRASTSLSRRKPIKQTGGARRGRGRGERKRERGR